MAQNIVVYTDDTDFGTLDDDLNSNFLTLQSNFSGTIFPANPTTGQSCFRTDRGEDVVGGGITGLMYIYSGNANAGESGWLLDLETSTIANELINARGSKLTLDQRLDVIMNEDGTLKPTATTGSQWTIGGYTFTYVDSSSFKTSGNTTDIFLANRRVKVNLEFSVVYGEVVSTVYDGGQDETTVTLDILTLDNTLVSVQHALVTLDEENGSLDVNSRSESAILHRTVPMRVKATEALSKGDLVKWSGYNSGEDAIEVVKTITQLDTCIGIANEDMALNEFGDVVTRGLIEGMDTSSQTGGTTMYSIGGGLASPDKPNGTFQAVAYVVKSHAITGAAMVDIGEHSCGLFRKNTVAQMESIDSPVDDDSCIVTDLDRGGLFIYDSTEVGNDNQGTNFSGWIRQYSGAVNVKWFGAKGDDSTDDSASIQATLDNSNNIYFPGGIYLHSTALTKYGNVSIFGEGKDSTIIKDTSTSSTYGITLGGTAPTQIAELSTDAVKGEQSFTLASAETLSDNDIVMIYNPTDYSWSAARTYYRAGEMCRVSGDSNSTEVSLYNSLIDDYVVADVDVYKMNMAEVNLIGFSVIANDESGSNGLNVVYAKDSLINNIAVFNGGNTSMSISLSYGVNIKNCIFNNNKEIGATGTNYGLAIGNSQEVNIIGISAFGQRHGLATGGADNYSVSCRYINISNSNFYSESLQSLDMHGNAEYFNFNNNLIEHGIVVAGDNHIITSNIIVGKIFNSSAIYIAEAIGLNYEISDNKIEVIVSSSITGRGLGLDFQGFENITRDGLLSIKDNVFNINSEGNTNSNNAVYLYRTSASDIDSNIDIIISGNTIKTLENDDNQVYIRNLDLTNGFGNIIIRDNSLTNSNIYLAGKSKSVDIDNNHLDTPYSYGIYCLSLECNFVNITNNKISRAKYSSVMVTGVTDESSIKVVNITGNVALDGNIEDTGSSSTNASVYVTKATQVKWFNNFTGSVETYAQRDYAIGTVTDYYHGSNVLLTGSATAVNNSATTTTVI
jgi:hypothetical protein